MEKRSLEENKDRYELLLNMLPPRLAQLFSKYAKYIFLDDAKEHEIKVLLEEHEVSQTLDPRIYSGWLSYILLKYMLAVKEYAGALIAGYQPSVSLQDIQKDFNGAIYYCEHTGLYKHALSLQDMKWLVLCLDEVVDGRKYLLGVCYNQQENYDIIEDAQVINATEAAEELSKVLGYPIYPFLSPEDIKEDPVINFSLN